MSPRFLSFMPFIFQWEGETYEHDPDDPGGATKFGIDQRSHPHEDIRNLTKDRALEIYFDSYWTPLRCDELPPKVGEVIMNIGVNTGIGHAKWLQELVGVTADGHIGPLTLAACAAFPSNQLAGDLITHLSVFYSSIARGSSAKYLKGWMNRTNSLKSFLSL